MEETGVLETPPPCKELKPCKVCGRTFFPGVLKKHVPICQKNAAKKRKTFNSSRQRAEGTDIPTIKPLKPKPEPPKKPSNWRRKHEEFLTTLRAAKGVTQAVKEGGPLLPPPPPSYDPDYIQCPYCRRRFGQSAADRHIAFCKEQAARIPNKGKIAGEGKAKLPARSLYKPPLAKRDGPAAASVTSPSSRLPQRSLQGQYGGGKPPNRAPSAGLIRNAPSASPPSRFGPSGAAEFPPGPPCSPGSLRTTPGIGTNSRRVHYADNNSLRNEVPPDLEDQDGSKWSKFCHECGAKYPVERAKFCCECGVARLRV
ncbi:zinc finger C2HC domain-containing protein 1A-like isoform X1 [Paramormyrops kingsleyae]|uniref:zinc finger C2HC domain-containing protein 1A-like isoform X1 n=1 Tax=Paramormyrops kingsleyae TaxID=1676925 RepID=UPI003B970B63